MEESIFDFRYVRLYDVDIPIFRKMVELFANSGDPDQMPPSAASDLGLHCLPVTHLRVFSPHWVNFLVVINMNKPYIEQVAAMSENFQDRS